jgi:hypothetical protein
LVGRRRVPLQASEEDARHLKDAERIEGSLEIRRELGSTIDLQGSRPKS